MADMLTCRICGDVYTLPEGEELRQCPSCGTVNARPQAEGEALDKLQRATRLRLKGEYAEALRSYDHVLLEYDDEHEALWGKLLCQYGVEFVIDPKTGVRHATVHVPSSRPMQMHADFERACELAPEAVRAQYEAEAAYVDEALAEINRRMDGCEPYDIFVCHKTTHLNSDGYTEDYNRAMRLSRRLEKAGYSVFFAPFSDLEPGASYEAGIYYALATAKVMLLISSDPAFLNSTWVKSEWSRYLEMLDDGADKHLIPLMYGSLTESRMPREIRLRRLQAIRMEDFDAPEKLMAALKKFTGKGAGSAPVPVAATPAVAPEKPAPAPAPMEKATPKAEAALQPKTVPVPVAKDEPAPVPAPVEKAEPKTRPATQSDYVTEAVYGGCVIMKYKGSDGSVTIPREIGGQKVISIGAGAFAGCTALHSVVIPFTVTSIADRAFANCTMLRRAVVPPAVVTIDDNAFSDSLSVTLVVRENSTAWEYAKKHRLRYELGSAATVSKAAPRVPSEATEPPSRRQVESCYATTPADGGVRITRYNGPGGHVDIPSRIGDKLVVEISINAFVGCKNITSVHIPAGVERFVIIYGSYNGDTKVYTTTNNPFLECSALCAITVADGNEAFFARDNVLFSSENAVLCYPPARLATSYDVPSGMKTIGFAAFAGCTHLSRVVLYDGVREIRGRAFDGCTALQSIATPGSLLAVDSTAFDNCPNLTIPLGLKMKMMLSNIF